MESSSSKSYGLPYFQQSSKTSASHHATSLTLPTTCSTTEGDACSKASTDSLLSHDTESLEVLKEPAPTKRKQKTLWESVDKTAFQFALRMGILLWFSSLFVLIRTDDYHFPDGMWVLVTVLFVSWFPQLDAASVIEKIIQRLLGTFIGAFLGLACGFASLLFTDRHFTQSIFLGTCVFIFNFLIIFVAGQFKVGRVKVIKRFAYATILCSLTFCICIMPFSMDEDPKWARAMYRVLNVVVGCFVGAIGSILIVPKSTTDVLYSKASRQVSMAGEAAEAVMNVSADYFSGRIQVNRLADELLNAPLESELRWRLSSTSSLGSSSRNADNPGATDVALKKYEDAIADWRLSKMLFPLVKYDPFRLKIAKDEVVSDAFQTEIARTLARCLRIQTTIVVLDGMVRSDADYEFTAPQLESFSQIGGLVRKMLTVPLDRDSSNAAANILFVKLEETREAIHKMSHAVATVAEGDDLSDSGREGLKEFQYKLLSKDSSFFETMHTDAGDEMGRGIPLNATGKHDNTLFFLQLVEHMILRSLRLYQAWTHVETLKRKED
ncbi:unnamed protein product [Cylindrotheca closterium]|nr:unnamed protein product [Cylindrotheca closterium]CAJ1965682.1 unnamed protein product [Cylindrotheca closterium]